MEYNLLLHDKLELLLKLIEQLKKFDSNLIYTKKWILDLGQESYPSQIVDHKFARERCLTTYKEGISLYKKNNLQEKNYI